MRYACYPSTSGANRIRLLLSDAEAEALKLDDATGLNVSFTVGNEMLFQPGKALLRRKDQGLYRLYDGLTKLQLPKCGAREVTFTPAANGHIGFTIPRLANPVRKRTAALQKNPQEYTFLDLKAAINLLQEIATALKVKLVLVEGEIYVKP
jgi:hypothetical protein